MPADEGFNGWVLGIWRRDQIPVWKAVLSEAEAKGQQKRAEYAHWILRDVLQEVTTEVSAETD